MHYTYKKNGAFINNVLKREQSFTMGAICTFSQVMKKVRKKSSNPEWSIRLQWEQYALFSNANYRVTIKALRPTRRGGLGVTRAEPA